LAIFKGISTISDWDEYEKGFGDPSEGEYWLGLANMRALTSQLVNPYTLRCYYSTYF